MPIGISEISIEQKDRLLSKKEGHFLDFKAMEVKPARLTKHLSAFANADGGELYIGIDEKEYPVRFEWRGFSTPEDANGHLQIFEELFPLGTDFEYGFLQCEGSAGFVLQIQVVKTREIKYASDRKPYLRRGAQSLPVNEGAPLKKLEYTKGLTSFETELVNIDIAEVTNSLPIIRFMLEVVPTSEPETWLRKQQVIRENKPTVAGLLLFTEEPQAFLPKRCGIKVYRYETQDAVGFREALSFDPITVEGCLDEQISTAVLTTVGTVEAIKRLGEGELENITYPKEAIHEIITNAVIHRDYSIADDVHIRIFDNRIEIESPGRLPAHITVKNILYERYARNGTIVRLLNKYPNPPNKDVGEGLNTAFAAMNQLGLKSPEIVEKENSVLVTIKHEPLASPETVILEYLESHESITNETARMICHIPLDRTVKTIFQRMIEHNIIEKVPGTSYRWTEYRKK